MGQKTVILISLFIIACLMAGIYGFLHDQISYSVSEEYFTQFKFLQFSIPDVLHNRIGAGMVGVLATWWMGIVIGIIIIPTGLIIPGWKNYFFSVIRSFTVVCATAFIIGIIAMIYGLLNFNTNNLPMFWYPEGVTNRVSFAVVGNMHNFSYIGGLIGIITGVLWIFREKKITKTRTTIS